MELSEYIRSLPGLPEREAFADAVGSSIGHLRNVGYGYRPCDPALALAIERFTRCQVTRAELRPDDYWLIWPDLPAPSTQEAA
jgi:DNA-binding transcriptional regulator YdaS (Cro superfamily)